MRNLIFDLHKVHMAAPPTEERMAALRGNTIRVTQMKKRKTGATSFKLIPLSDVKISE